MRYFFSLAGTSVLLLQLAAFVAASPTALIKTKVAKSRAQAKDIIPNSYIVCYASNVNSTVAAAHEELVTKMMAKRGNSSFLGGIGASFSMDGFRGYQITADPSEMLKISQSSNVAWIEKDAKVYASQLTTQSNALYGLSRVSHRAGDEGAYVFDASAGKGVDIYVVDTGVLATHSEFGGRAKFAANFVTGSANTDENGHGTHCAGTAAGATFGVAKQANVFGVKVLNADGAGSNSAVIAGINFVAQNAKNGSVLSMSLGGSFSQAVNMAVAAVVAKGITAVVAAGNEGVNAANDSPASATAAITVGAIDANDTRPSFSNFGRAVDIFAPGVKIQSAFIGSNNATETLSGTSMACPHVAGMAAYLIALEGLKTPAAVAARIKSLATVDSIAGPGNGSPNLILYNGSGQ